MLGISLACGEKVSCCTKRRNTSDIPNPSVNDSDRYHGGDQGWQATIMTLIAMSAAAGAVGISAAKSGVIAAASELLNSHFAQSTYAMPSIRRRQRSSTSTVICRVSSLSWMAFGTAIPSIALAAAAQPHPQRLPHRRPADQPSSPVPGNQRDGGYHPCR